MNPRRPRAIRRTVQVRDDIIEIYQYIYPRNPRAAERMLDAIERSIRALVDAPGVGRFWNSPDPRLDGLRITTVTPYRDYLIFFRAKEHVVGVFRIVHGMRELQPLIDEIQIDFEEE